MRHRKRTTPAHRPPKPIKEWRRWNAGGRIKRIIKPWFLVAPSKKIPLGFRAEIWGMMSSVFGEAEIVEQWTRQNDSVG